jgi:hypothetical protein
MKHERERERERERNRAHASSKFSSYLTENEMRALHSMQWSWGPTRRESVIVYGSSGGHRPRDGRPGRPLGRLPQPGEPQLRCTAET